MSKDVNINAESSNHSGIKQCVAINNFGVVRYQNFLATCGMGEKNHGEISTGRRVRMSHRKWREAKQGPSRARPGTQLGCCLFSLHFLCDILQSSPVDPVQESCSHIRLSSKRYLPDDRWSVSTNGIRRTRTVSGDLRNPLSRPQLAPI